MSELYGWKTARVTVGSLSPNRLWYKEWDRAWIRLL